MTAIEPRPGLMRRLEWRRAKVRQVIVETSRVKSLLLEVAGWQGHLPGQHVDVRLTGEDGYQAQRSYSIASPAEGELVALTVERVENGEVSPYLVDEIRDRRPIRVARADRRLLRLDDHHGRSSMSHSSRIGNCAPYGDAPSSRQASARVPAVLLAFARSVEDVIYRKELDTMARRDPDLRVVGALTRQQPEGWTGYRRRIDKLVLADACFPPERNAKIYVCGPTPFVEDVSGFLVELGHDGATIKTERFGPTGG